MYSERRLDLSREQQHAETMKKARAAHITAPFRRDANTAALNPPHAESLTQHTPAKPRIQVG